MANLYEKYRPRRLSQIIGQDRVVAQVRQIAARGLAGRAYWISGKSGQGKTTLARCMAAEVADDFFVTEIDAGSLTVAGLRDIERASSLCAWGRGGRVWIVNEAHGLRRDVVRALLVLLESIPRHVMWVFTTTTDGMGLFEDGQIDAGPLLSRCIGLSLTSQGVARAFASLVSRIAQREQLDGRPLADYLRLANDCKGNCRAMLQAVGAGVMLAGASK